MPSNVDVKAKVKDMAALRAMAAEAAADPPVHLKQSDTFFRVPKGRLKLRVVNDEAELIYYERPDRPGPKPSDFHTTPVSDPDSLRETLRLALGVIGTVEKERWLYMVGQTRVHCDNVKGLGEYMELEVQLGEGDTVDKCVAIAHELMAKFQIPAEDTCTGAYMDMLLEGEKQ